MQFQFSRRRAVYAFGISVVVIVVLGLLASWWRASVIAAPANAIVGAPPADLPAEPVEFTSEAGATIRGWYVPAENSSATVILAHPIRGNRLEILERGRMLWRAGYNVLLIDLQAHGERTGDAITFGYRERLDVKAAVAFARRRDPAHKIAVVGRSLGGAAAVLASPLGIDALVIESVYPTIDDAVKDRMRIRIGPLASVVAPLLEYQLELRLGISPDQLRPIDDIAKVGCPILVMAGANDKLTTLAESQQLFEAATDPKEFVVFDSAGHADLLSENLSLYKEHVLAFLAKYLPSETCSGAQDGSP